ncbi:MAG: ABC transporter permease [Gemmatimonadetes bacterium]|nr:ABC transporter permease [Gemmatimonadota bacterium]
MADARPRGEDTPRTWREYPIVQLTLARYREFYREPEAMFWTFVFPLLMAAGLGVAFRSRPPEVIPIALVQELAGTSAAATALSKERQLDLRTVSDSTGRRLLRTGKVALLVVPTDSQAVEFRFDNTRPEAVTARRIVDDALQRGRGRTDPVAVGEDIVTDRGSRYIDFLVPGLLGMNLMSSSMWGIGFSVVDQRRKRLLKRFVATPMSRPQYLASFVLARLSLLVIEVAFLVGMGALVFDVPVRGSLLALGVVSLLGTLAFGGLGLLVAARPKTVEAASGMMNFSMLPMWVLSGVFFSSSNFPDAIQPFIQALPLTALNDALRANMLEGAGFLQLAGELGIMAAWLLATFPIALKIFRWQ